MKLLELKIRNIRGVTRLDVRPAGKTHVLLGNNGTGKSAVVDALDFLFTGEMKRLSERRGFTLNEHGKHINASPEHCYVEATLDVPGVENEVVIRRQFAQPRALEVPKEAREALAGFLEIAEQRQYVLARHNLLRLITERPADRAGLVQSVLNIHRVEELRKSLTTATNDAARNFKTERNARVSAEGAVSQTLKLPQWDSENALAAVNELRGVLDGNPVDVVTNLKLGLDPPTFDGPAKQDGKPASPDATLTDINRVGSSLSEKEAVGIDALDDVLREKVGYLTATPERVRLAQQAELVEIGLTLLGDATKCPLCDTAWDPEALKELLDAKATDSKAAADAWSQVRETADALLRWIGDSVQTTTKIREKDDLADEKTDPAALEEFARSLTKLTSVLTDPLTFLEFREAGMSLSDQLGASPARERLRALFAKVKTAAAADPRRTAWDDLTRCEENLKALKAVHVREDRASKSAVRTDALLSSFIRSRDAVLSDLYASVEDRFVALYKALHAPDEQGFGADITPKDAGLDFQVDFHGTGKVAPFALHSEGHQDSMGLCLFLALTERVQGTRLGFCVLDDVVMAVDAGHRLSVAKLLKMLGTETQFIIATHDRTWARQLQQEGCVTSKQLTHFIGWEIDGGPLIAELTDFIGESHAALEKGNVRDAAASLRYGLESFFHMAAHSLRACPPYSLAAQYEFGQMFYACNSRLKELVKNAKSAATSWNGPDSRDVAVIATFEEHRKQTLSTVDAEQWTMNSNVHFNAWMTMTADEFRPVLVSFNATCELFKCPDCGSLRTVVGTGPKETAVKCGCGKAFWNLEKK